MEFKGTKGRWHFRRPMTDTLAILENDKGEQVCNFGNNYQYYPTEGEEPNDYDALLISKAPELLEMHQMRIFALDNGNIAFYEKYGFNVSELDDRTRKLIQQSTEL